MFAGTARSTSLSSCLGALAILVLASVAGGCTGGEVRAVRDGAQGDGSVLDANAAGLSRGDVACLSDCGNEVVPCCRAGHCDTNACGTPGLEDAGLDAMPSAKDASPEAGIDAGGTEGGVTEAGADATASAGPDGGDGGNGNVATVSFANDVMPVFQRGCTLSSVCHGQPNNAAEENLYLGDNVTNTPATIAQVYASLVGVKSIEDPSMNQVTAGNVANSYLSRKIVGDQDTLAAGCAMAAQPCEGCTAQTPCGTFMPYLGVMLDPGAIDAINQWIAEGAPNN
jgi:hypothetical protein